MINWKEDYWTKPVKSKRLFDNPVIAKPHPNFEGGKQRIYRFDNNYGASLVRWKTKHLPELSRSYGSYTRNENEWEMALIYFSGKSNDNFKVVYDMPEFGDVIGYLSEDEVEQYLKKIKAFR